MDHPSPKIFVDDETGYLAWVHAHPDGFVANLDEPLLTPHYPMVHAASHKLMSSPRRSNYTTGRYYKVCSDDLAVLEAWAKKKHGRALTRCKQCM